MSNVYDPNQREETHKLQIFQATAKFPIFRKSLLKIDTLWVLKNYEKPQTHLLSSTKINSSSGWFLVFRKITQNISTDWTE